MCRGGAAPHLRERRVQFFVIVGTKFRLGEIGDERVHFKQRWSDTQKLCGQSGCAAASERVKAGARAIVQGPEAFDHQAWRERLLELEPPLESETEARLV